MQDCSAPVFRAAIDTPEPRAAEVCEPGAELKPQQSEQPKDEVAAGGRVRHDLTDFETRLVLEQTIENVEGVSNRSGNNDGVGRVAITERSWASR